MERRNEVYLQWGNANDEMKVWQFFLGSWKSIPPNGPKITTRNHGSNHGVGDETTLVGCFIYFDLMESFPTLFF